MQQSELPSGVAQQIAALVRECSRVLLIGCQLDLPHAVAVDGVAAALACSERFAAVVWCEPTDLAHEARRVRRTLEQGGRLLIVSAVQPPTLSRLRAFVVGERLRALSLEELCTALLLAGFAEPRVQPTVSGMRFVAARLPTDAHSLDAMFDRP